MCTDMHIDMCIDMFIDMHVGVCIDMFIDMHIDMCIDMCIAEFSLYLFASFCLFVARPRSELWSYAITNMP